jgi:predicted MFS family arabinose efflux permease
MERKVSERVIVFLVGAVQFVNVMDFVMVAPLGPDFARALGIPNSQIGLITGSYTAAAALSGIAGSFFLDRFDRRKALAVTMLGLVLGTAAGGLAHGLGSLVAARVLAGMFGGPATSVALSIIADVVPNERRGKALGAVMGAFSVAQVLGMPLALKASEWFGWQVPFLGVAGMGLVVSLSAVFMLPALTGHLSAARLQQGHRLEATRRLLGRREVQTSYLMTAVVNAAGFILIPNISAYVQQNLHYPRSSLGTLYLAGGVVSFLTLRVVGRLVDRFGSFKVGTFGSALLGVVLYGGFIRYVPGFPVVGIFMGFMLAMAFRNVSYSTLTSKVPGGAERAQFMSLQSAVQHIASSVGALASSWLLAEAPDGQLVGMETAALFSLGLNALLPLLLWTVEDFVQRRSLAAAPPASLAPASPAAAPRP